MQERNKRIFEHIKNKMNYMFKEVLTEIEIETKKFGVKEDFFAKSKDKKPKGFYACRKKLFTHGNNIVKFLDIVLSETEVVPKRSIVDNLPDEAFEKKKKNDRIKM